MNATLRAVRDRLGLLCLLGSRGCASDGLVTPTGNDSAVPLVFGAIADYA